MQSALRLIQHRNRTASTILAALMLHGRRGKAGLEPDFGWLEAMLEYVQNQVRGRHFADEELLILSPLEQKVPELRPKLARARRDHIGSGGYCFRMKEALANWKRGWPKGLDQYFDNARDHWRLSVAHRRLMRESILPAAAAAFADSQWPSILAALSQSPDPLERADGRSELEAALCSMMGRVSLPDAAALARAPIAASAHAGRTVPNKNTGGRNEHR